MRKVLIVEDDAALAETVAAALEEEGFRVDRSEDGAAGLRKAAGEAYDLLVLDFGLPSLSGLEIIRSLRENGNRTPVIMLTGEKKEEIDRIVGLEMGADDYLLKPFVMRELLARIHALLRRSRIVAAADRIPFAGDVPDRGSSRDSGRGSSPDRPGDHDRPRADGEVSPSGAPTFSNSAAPAGPPLSPGPSRSPDSPSSPLPPFRQTETFPAPSPVRELATGAVFAGRYQIIEELGRGGMGRVYKVYDTRIKEKVALKLIKPEVAADRETIERFSGEIRLARRIGHRNVCRMFDLGEADGARFITMEYVHGEDLKGMLRMSGSLSVGMLLSVGKQVCDGLAEAHALGIVHRDLKPQNIMIDRSGSAKIMDFGIARSVREKGITGPSVVVGTPEYMSPEQAEGKAVDPRSDIYSLGVILFEMATSRVPFDGDSALAVAMKHKGEAPPDPRRLCPGVPADLCGIILKCLEKEPGRRYQGAADLRADLDRVEKGLPTTRRVAPERRPPTLRTITVRLPPRKIWIPAAALLVLAAAFIVWQFVPGAAAASRSIAVLGFRNRTGDAAFDYLQETIPNLLITSLEQSRRFRVTSWQRLNDLARQAGRDSAAALDEDAGFEICRREGIDALAVGFYSKAGETFVTDVKLLDAATKDTLKTAQAQGDGAASILKTQIDEISRTVARGLGRSVLKIERAAAPVADLTTSSLEAYSWFLRGRDEHDRFLYTDARASLEKAIALDPGFAVAHSHLAMTLAALTDFPRRDEELKKAWSLAGNATEKERLYIEAQYALEIERDPERRSRALRALVDKYPQEKYAWYELERRHSARDEIREAIAAGERAVALDPAFGAALNQLGYDHARLGEYPRAIEYLERYAAVNPTDPNPRDSIAEVYMHMGRLEDSDRAYRALLADRPDRYSSWLSLAYVCALREDYPELDRCLGEYVTRSAAASPATGVTAQYIRAFFDYFQGRWRRAGESLAPLREWSVRAGADYFVYWLDWGAFNLAADSGDFAAAREAVERVHAVGVKLNLKNGAVLQADRDIANAWADMRQGRYEAALAAMNRVEPLPPGVNDTMRMLLQVGRAEAVLGMGEVEGAIAAGRAIERPVFSSLNELTTGQYNIPFLRDVLARAYWKAGDLDAAAAEYRRLLTVDPADRVRTLIHPLYHYRLGLVLEEKRDQAGARAEYAKFLECWSDADPTHPELADARARLAKLGG